MMAGLTKDQTDSTQISLIFTNMFTKRINGHTTAASVVD